MALDPVSIAQWTTALSVGGSAAYGVYRFGKSKVMPVVRGIGEGLAALSDVRELRDKVQEIHHEVRPNGGGSIKDAITRIERSTRLTGEVVRAMSNGGAPVFQAEASGAWLWSSEPLLRLIGKGRSETAPWGWINAVAPHQRAAIRAEIASALDERREIHQQVTLTDAVGRYIDTDWHVVPVADPVDGKIHGWIGTVRVLEDKTPPRRSFPPDDGA